MNEIQKTKKIHLQLWSYNSRRVLKWVNFFFWHAYNDDFAVATRRIRPWENVLIIGF